MRMLATHYGSKAQPALVKKRRSEIKHLTAPLKGLSLATTLGEGDPQTATILTNFVLEADRIQSRAGYKKVSSITPPGEIWCLIPYYATTGHMLAAANNSLYDALNGGAAVKTGFTSNDWHWSSFSNLSSQDYTVMVNGADGVWSWDGGFTSTNPAPVAVTNLSKANPAVCTVAAGDISKFTNGTVVTIAGATGTGLINANGPHLIGNVGSPANTFTLLGVDTSAAAAPQTSGVTADPPSTGIVKETVTAPTDEPWIQPEQFNVVLSHQNRLWFADSSNLAVYYLPIQQKSGEVHYLPLNAVFRRGGSIRAMYTWTVDGGAGMDDQLVIFSTNGECVIYSGTDPDSADAFNLVGIFRFSSPMSKHCAVNYGGDLYVLINTGLTPMTTVIRSESENLALADQHVVTLFREASTQFRDRNGWSVILNPSSGRLFCNVPQGSKNRYTQIIRHMTQKGWSQFEDVPARCWNWIDPWLYFGDDDGNVYAMHPVYLNDDGKPIRLDVQMAWNSFKTSAQKKFLVLQSYLTTDGDPRPLIDIKTDYDMSSGVNVPDASFGQLGAAWNLATWDVDYWATGPSTITLWNGVAALGHVGAVRLTVSVLNSTFSINGFDVVFETGVYGP